MSEPRPNGSGLFYWADMEGKKSKMTDDDDGHEKWVLKSDIDLKTAQKINKRLAKFERKATMISRLKRAIIRKDLKQRKMKLLTKVIEINKKLKILDEMDGETKD